MTHTRTPLVLTALAASHGSRPPGERRVFERVSLTVEPGEVLGIFGPNGCGKTTLLRTIAGTHAPSSGEVKLPRTDAATNPRVAIVPQSHRASFFGWARLRTNLALTAPGGIANRRENAKRIDEARTQLGSDLDLHLLPHQCSDGMLQQAAMIRALAAEPDLLLADEPFSALDVEVAPRFRRAFRDVVTGRGLVAAVVLHDIQSIVEVCDRVLVIPGTPYTTERGEHGLAAARLLDNGWRRRDGAASGPEARESFLEIMTRVLAAADGRRHV